MALAVVGARTSRIAASATLRDAFAPCQRVAPRRVQPRGGSQTTVSDGV